jgi:probable F420-dependent oxidoreductase
VAIRFGVQADVRRDGRAWLDLAAKTEALGFDALYAADHPGVTASPFVALSTAAAVTSTLRLGTYVVNCGVRDALTIASDAATLDTLSHGRAILGLGAGHTPAEWTMTGAQYPPAAARIARLAEIVEAVTALLRGEVVTRHGNHVHLEEAFLLSPRPAQARMPLLVGGNGRALLRLAVQYADVVSVTGATTTLADGHRHAVDWRPRALDERVALVHATAPDPGALVIDALVQHVEITNDRAGAAARVAGTAPGLTPADVLDSPYTLIGSHDEIVEELHGHESRWGITSYVVRAGALDAVAPLLGRLSD